MGLNELAHILLIEDKMLTKIKINSYLFDIFNNDLKLASITDQEHLESNLIKLEKMIKKGKFSEDAIDIIFLSSHLRSARHRNSKMSAKENIERIRQLFPYTKIYILTSSLHFNEVYDEVYNFQGVDLILKPVKEEDIKKIIYLNLPRNDYTQLKGGEV